MNRIEWTKSISLIGAFTLVLAASGDDEDGSGEGAEPTTASDPTVANDTTMGS